MKIIIRLNYIIILAHELSACLMRSLQVTCTGSITYPNGDVYHGQLRIREVAPWELKPHGHGKLTPQTGDASEGEWRAGLRHGFGRYISKEKVIAWKLLDFRGKKMLPPWGHPRQKEVSNDRYARWEHGKQVQDFITLQMVPPVLPFGDATWTNLHYQAYLNCICRKRIDTVK